MSARQRGPRASIATPMPMSSKGHNKCTNAASISCATNVALLRRQRLQRGLYGAEQHRAGIGSVGAGGGVGQVVFEPAAAVFIVSGGQRRGALAYWC
jgi:hypothetical protein